MDSYIHVHFNAKSRRGAADRLLEDGLKVGDIDWDIGTPVKCIWDCQCTNSEFDSASPASTVSYRVYLVD